MAEYSGTTDSGWDESLVEVLWAHSSDGLFLVDREMRLLRANSTVHDMWAAPVEDLQGTLLSEATSAIDTDALIRLLRRVLVTGQPIVDAEQPVGTAAQVVFSVSAYPLKGRDGQPGGVLGRLADISSLVRTRARAELLRRAQKRLGTRLDVRSTALELAEITVPTLADCATVDVRASVFRGEVSIAPGEEKVLVRRVRVAAATSASDRAADHLVEYPLISRPSQALIDLRPRLLPRADGEQLKHLRQDGLIGDDGSSPISLMLVPLAVRDVALGIVTLTRTGHRPPFDEDDLAFAVELVERTALHLDSARRAARERATAGVLQRSLLPGTASDRVGVESAASYTPSAHHGVTGAGGDWYDVIPLPGARVALVVGEVAGHGVHAAAAMGRLRAAVRALAALDLPPDKLLAKLNYLALRLADEPSYLDESEPTVRQPLGATCLYMIHDPIDSNCTVASAGHPLPLVAPPDGHATLMDAPRGPRLGHTDLPFEVREVPVAEGSVLALYTHGLVSSHPAGRDTALRHLGGALEAGGPIQEVCDAATRKMLPVPPTDDAVLLAARTRKLHADSVVSWDVTPDPAGVAGLRQVAVQHMTAWNLAELSFSAELVISELLTNAITYGSPPVRLRLIRDDGLVCEVFDSSNATPHLHHSATGEEGGRGLFLVTQLSESWGVRHGLRGKAVWARVRE